MKQFILGCCLLVLVVSSPVPQDDLQPVNDSTKDFSSKFSPASSPLSSPTFPSDSKTAGAHSAFGSPSGYDYSPVTRSVTESDLGNDSGNVTVSRRKRSEEGTDSASADEVKEKVDTATILSDNNTTDIFPWQFMLDSD